MGSWGSQAEHDTEARPILVSTSEALVASVNACLKKRLAVLPTRDTALEAVKKGFAVVCKVGGGVAAWKEKGFRIWGGEGGTE